MYLDREQVRYLSSNDSLVIVEIRPTVSRSTWDNCDNNFVVKNKILVLNQFFDTEDIKVNGRKQNHQNEKR